MRSALLLAACLALPCPAQPGRYRADPIPAFSTSGLRIAYALTPDGRAAGTQTVRSYIQNGHVFRIDAGFVFVGREAVPVLPVADGLTTSVRALSPSGLLVGSASDGTATRAAWLSTAAAPVFLPLPSGPSSAQGVNDAGTVVGTMTLADGRRRAFLWSQAQGLRDPLPPDATLATAFAINAAGEVVGEFTPASGGPKRAFTLRPGQELASDLNAALPPDSPWSLEQGWGVSDAGIIACNGTLAGAARASLIRPEDPRTPVELAPVGGFPATIVYGLNTRGDAVGLSLVSLAFGARRPTLWRDGEAIDLTDRVINAIPGTIWNSVTAVNDAGQILAQWITPAGQNMLVRLTPLCDADLSGDGLLGPVDVELFLQRFDGEGIDFDGDGFGDFFDLMAFFDAYEGRTGCPAP